MKLNKRVLGRVIAVVAGLAIAGVFIIILRPFFEGPPSSTGSVMDGAKPFEPKKLEPQKDEKKPLPPLRQPPANVRRRDVPAVPPDTQQVARARPPEGGNPNPQWTKPLAMPAKHPVPPAPFTPPPMKVDPARKPEPEVERLQIK